VVVFWVTVNMNMHVTYSSLWLVSQRKHLFACYFLPSRRVNNKIPSRDYIGSRQ